MDLIYPSFDETRYLHARLMLVEGQSSVLMSGEKLESALLRPQAEAFGEEFYPSIAEKAAVLLQGVVIAHPFTDGNKRIGLAVTLAFLKQNGIETIPDEDALYDFVIAVTTGELREVEEIAAEVRRLFSLS